MRTNLVFCKHWPLLSFIILFVQLLKLRKGTSSVYAPGAALSERAQKLIMWNLIFNIGIICCKRLMSFSFIVMLITVPRIVLI